MKIKYFLLLAVLFLPIRLMIADNYYPASDQRIINTGRIDFDQQQNALIFWSGNYTSFSFTGTKVSVILSGTNSKVALYVDGVKQPALYSIKKDLDTVNVVQNLSLSQHLIVVRRASLVDLPLIKFHGILTDGELIDPSREKKLKLEFYGNSVSEGYAASTPDGVGRDNRVYDDNSSAYTCLLAQLLNADYQNVSIGGIAVCEGAGSVKIGMETRFDKLYPFTSASKWDFTKYKPDLCIMALGVNEYYNSGGIAWNQWRARYKNIIYSLLQKYGQETVFLFAAAPMIPSRSDPVLNIKQLVSELSAEGVKAYQYVYSFYSYNGHPIASEHVKMANELYNFIETNHIITDINQTHDVLNNLIRFDTSTKQLIVESTGSEMIDSIRIYSTTGSIKFEQPIKNQSCKIFLNNYNPGVYIVTVTYKGIDFSKRILITN